MCQGCTEGLHWLCGMQTWCECDCDGPDGFYGDSDPYELTDQDGFPALGEDSK